ncbi:hypothetical protein NU219Hw_g5785t1 [Hortaea werneckii]
MSDVFELLSSTNSGSEGEEMDDGVSVGGGAELAHRRKAQSAFSTKDKEEMYCRHIVQPRIPNEFGKEEGDNRKKEDLLKVVFRLQDAQEAWDKEQARLPSDQRTERNVFDEYVRRQRKIAKRSMRSLPEHF